MFIEKEDLYTAIGEAPLQHITTSAATVQWAIRAAIEEARSYLNARYDCAAIFSAQGDERHATLLEHCKNIAVWYLCRRANIDLLFAQVREYRNAAIDWLEKVASIGSTPVLMPDLPLRPAAQATEQ